MTGSLNLTKLARTRENNFSPLKQFVKLLFSKMRQTLFDR